MAMNMDSRIFILFLACSIIGVTSAADIKKCYQCSGKIDSCKQAEETCKAQAPGAAPGGVPGGANNVSASAEASTEQPAATAEGGAQAGAASPPPPAAEGGSRLVERDEAAGTFKCLKITKNKTDLWKGCGVSCKSPPGGPIDKSDECVECDDKDLCNLAIRINSIGWIFALVVIICCFGVQY